MKIYPGQLIFQMQFSRALTKEDEKKLDSEIQRFLRRLASVGYLGSRFAFQEFRPIEVEEKPSGLIIPGSKPAEA